MQDGRGQRAEIMEVDRRIRPRGGLYTTTDSAALRGRTASQASMPRHGPGGGHVVVPLGGLEPGGCCATLEVKSCCESAMVLVSQAPQLELSPSSFQPCPSSRSRWVPAGARSGGETVQLWGCWWCRTSAWATTSEASNPAAITAASRRGGRRRPYQYCDG